MTTSRWLRPISRKLQSQGSISEIQTRTIDLGELVRTMEIGEVVKTMRIGKLGRATATVPFMRAKYTQRNAWKSLPAKLAEEEKAEADLFDAQKATEPTCRKSRWLSQHTKRLSSKHLRSTASVQVIGRRPSCQAPTLLHLKPPWTAR